MRPFWQVSTSIRNTLGKNSERIKSKKALIAENEQLKTTIAEKDAFLAQYPLVLHENTELKALLGRKIIQTETIVGTILVKPNRSPYDTIILDIGSGDNVDVGARIFAHGKIYIGDVVATTLHTATVALLSTADKTTQVNVDMSNTTLDLIGNGGGSFEMTLPKGFVFKEGMEVTSLGLTAYPIAIAEKVISDARDPIQKVLLRSLVNIQEVRFVQVEK